MICILSLLCCITLYMYIDMSLHARVLFPTTSDVTYYYIYIYIYTDCGVNTKIMILLLLLSSARTLNSREQKLALQVYITRYQSTMLCLFNHRFNHWTTEFVSNQLGPAVWTVQDLQASQSNPWQSVRCQSMVELTGHAGWQSNSHTP